MSTKEKNLRSFTSQVCETEQDGQKIQDAFNLKAQVLCFFFFNIPSFIVIKVRDDIKQEEQRARERVTGREEGGETGRTGRPAHQ